MPSKIKVFQHYVLAFFGGKCEGDHSQICDYVASSMLNLMINFKVRQNLERLKFKFANKLSMPDRLANLLLFQCFLQK